MQIKSRIPPAGEFKSVPVETTTLWKQFEKAGKEDTVFGNGNTFAGNTSHTLKMFYLERGNYDPSLALRFNLQTMLYQQIASMTMRPVPVSRWRRASLLR